jgi:thiamine-monophosphate kinase
MRSEFEFIQNIKKKYSLAFVGDDCAVLPKDDKTDLLITSDMLVEDIDFRLEWTTPEFLGHKALAVSLSDIAAMGGEPKFAMLSIAVSEKLWKTDFIDRFYEGWCSLARKHEVEIIGGDVSKSPDKLVIDSTVLGEVPKGKAIVRAGAKVGNAIFVTGFLGGAAAGLYLLENGARFESDLPVTTQHLLLRQLQPIPQVNTGKLLREYGLATSMIDVSDGLSSDLLHLVRASDVGAKIIKKDIPLDPAISVVPDANPLGMALHGGEDFELLFTTSNKNIAIAKDLGFHIIGEITDKDSVIELISDGKSSMLEPRGFRHF